MHQKSVMVAGRLADLSQKVEIPYLGVVSTTKPLMHVKGTLGVFAVWPFALSASAVSFLGWPVHGTLHNVATPRTLHQSKMLQKVFYCSALMHLLYPL